MRVLVIHHHFGRIEIAVADNNVVDMANILEASSTVQSFHVDGLNVVNQQKAFGAGDFTKWNSPIQQ